MKMHDLNEHPVGMEFLEQTLRGLGEFYYWPNEGNLGDYLIAEATRQLFRKLGLEWKEYCPENLPGEDSYVLVYGGGGRFVPHWGGMELFQEHLTRPQVRRSVILPHSINGVDDFVKSLDERHILFLRERKSLVYCSSLNDRIQCILAHDMGLYLKIDQLPGYETELKLSADADAEAREQYQVLTGIRKPHAEFRMKQATVSARNSGRKVAFVLRTDREKCSSIESAWAYDLSILYSGSCRETPYSARIVRLMADVLRSPDVVVTDRLHVAIMAMHAGREVYMMDNDYGKLSGVYEVSLKEVHNVHLLQTGQAWPSELQQAWEELNTTAYRGNAYAPVMTDGPLVSVIVPVYNTGPWLRRCLDSICSQSYQNLEILCVNDGSTDNSAEILEEYAAKDSRIKVYTQENAGLSAARNTALEHANGEWVTGVDSDDYLEPGVYERVIQRATSEVDMICYGVNEVREDGSPLPLNLYFDLPAAGIHTMSPSLAKELNVCFWSNLWRLDVIEKHRLRFPEGLIHEDEALFHLYVPYVREVAVCPEIGYHYVQRSGSIMNAVGLTDLRRAERHVPVLAYVASQYDERGWLREGNRAYLLNMFRGMCANSYWIVEDGQAIRRLYGGLIQKYRLYRDDYRLERLLPVKGWLCLFLSRYEWSRVYRFLGIAVWSVLYSDTGQRIGSSFLLPGALKKLFRLR